MLRKSEGFFLIDLLSALAALVLITGGLVPIYLHLSKQSISLEKKLQATYLLFDQLFEEQADELPQNIIITHDDQEYKVIWDHWENSSFKEVCIHYRDGFHQAAKTCKYSEQ